MAKGIITSVVSALIIATVLWLVGVLEKIPAIVSVPVGAVVAFETESCPSPGWTEYKGAYGRFIRGIDRSGMAIDPDHESRKIGSAQPDAIQYHSHTTEIREFGHDRNDGGLPNKSEDNDGREVTKESVPGPKGHFSSETRPKNVALLYCLKT